MTYSQVRQALGLSEEAAAEILAAEVNCRSTEHATRTILHSLKFASVAEAIANRVPREELPDAADLLLTGMPDDEDNDAPAESN